MDKIDIPWLQPLAEAWIAAEERRRPAHAVLLAGAPGVGKRAAAAWMVARRLGIDRTTGVPQYPPDRPRHADLHWLQPPQGKKGILIDQVRELVADIGLTGYSGTAKAAVIEPANAMTAAAANSFLKTLEEPRGDALLVLIADRLGGLPATILSRCQRMTVPTPAQDVSLRWLERLQPAPNWAAALQVAGLAPLAAIEALERLDLSSAMTRDLVEIAERRLSPILVAGQWAAQEPEFVLAWLGRQVQQCIHQASGSAGAQETRLAESVLKRVDRRNLFCYLDIINRLRSQPPGSFNPQLALESLLIDWAEGLQTCCDKFIPGGLLPIPDLR